MRHKIPSVIITLLVCCAFTTSKAMASEKSVQMISAKVLWMTGIPVACLSGATLLGSAMLAMKASQEKSLVSGMVPLTMGGKELLDQEVNSLNEAQSYMNINLALQASATFFSLAQIGIFSNERLSKVRAFGLIPFVALANTLSSLVFGGMGADQELNVCGDGGHTDYYGTHTPPTNPCHLANADLQAKLSQEKMTRAWVIDWGIWVGLTAIAEVVGLAPGTLILGAFGCEGCGDA